MTEVHAIYAPDVNDEPMMTACGLRSWVYAVDLALAEGSDEVDRITCPGCLAAMAAGVGPAAWAVCGEHYVTVDDEACVPAGDGLVRT